MDDIPVVLVLVRVDDIPVVLEDLPALPHQDHVAVNQQTTQETLIKLQRSVLIKFVS